MQRPIPKPHGTPVDELDTPALILDLDSFENAAARFGNPAKPARVEAWVHKTPAIAARQVAVPGIAGIAVRSIGEAEVFAASGFDDIRILRPLATARSRQRAEALAATAALAFEPDRPLCGADWLRDAVTVSTRVGGVPEPGRAILDAGQKAVGRDFGDPTVRGLTDVKTWVGSAEHGMVGFSEPATLAIGDWLQLVPADVATVFALHDFVYAVRDGKLEAAWPVAARGVF